MRGWHRYPAYVTSAGWIGSSPLMGSRRRALCTQSLTPPHYPFSSHPIPLCSPGYSDEKIARLTKEAIQAGFNHFKMKVGADLADDLRRGRLIRSIIDDPQSYPTDDPESARRVPDGPALAGKNAGPTGAVLMIDANQVWDVPQAIDYVSSLAEINPWCAHVSLSFPLFSSVPNEGFS